MLGRIAAVSLVAALVVGCNGTDPTSPLTGPSSGTSADAKTLATASGAGHYLSNPGGLPDPDGEWRTFSFTARQTADGATGQFEAHNRAQGISVHGEITCLSVSGNQAWFSGVVTNSSNPNAIGSYNIFRVVDNGEGSKAVPDQISPAGGGIGPIDCSLHQNLLLTNLEAGNIQVR